MRIFWLECEERLFLCSRKSNKMRWNRTNACSWRLQRHQGPILGWSLSRDKTPTHGCKPLCKLTLKQLKTWDWSSKTLPEVLYKPIKFWRNKNQHSSAAYTRSPYSRETQSSQTNSQFRLSQQPRWIMTGLLTPRSPHTWSREWKKSTKWSYKSTRKSCSRTQQRCIQAPKSL